MGLFISLSFLVKKLKFKFEKVMGLPGARMESPPFQPMISLIRSMTTFSMRMKTGAIS